MDLSDLTAEFIKKACTQKSYKRGRAYYRAGRVVSISWGANRVRARVRGTRMYRVELEDHGPGGISYYCTCPYDMDGPCKHVVAVMLFMRSHAAEASRVARAAEAGDISTLDEAAPGYAGGLRAGKTERDRPAAKRRGAGTARSAAAGADHAEMINSLFSMARPSGGPLAGLVGGGWNWGQRIDLGPFIDVASRLERAGYYEEAVRVYGQIADATAANAGHDKSYDGVIRESIRGTGRCTAAIKDGAKMDAEARIREMLGRYRAAGARFRGDCEAALLSACASGTGPALLLAAVRPHAPGGGRARGGDRGVRRAGEKPAADGDGGRMLALMAVAMEGLGDGDAAEKMLAGHAAAGPETYAMYAEHLVRAGQRGRASRVAMEGIDRLGDGDDRLVDAALGALGPGEPGRRALLERAYVRSRDPARLRLLKEEPGAWPASRRRLIARLARDKKHPERLLGLLLAEGMYKRALRALAVTGNADLLYKYRDQIGSRFPRSYLVAYQYCIETEAAGARDMQAYRSVVQHLGKMERLPAKEARARTKELAEALSKLHAKRSFFATLLKNVADDI